MNPFAKLPHSDFEVISPEGDVRCSGSGIFSGETVVVSDERLVVFPNDEIRRRLPNGTDEVFDVVDPKFFDRVKPLPSHFQIKVRRKGTSSHGEGGDLNITMTGNNSRVNISSVDNSKNTVKLETPFAEIVQAIENNVEGEEGADLVSAVHEMKRTQGTGGYTAAYQHFVSLAANHMNLVAPFLPALTELL